jgi:hypothetical protein
VNSKLDFHRLFLFFKREDIGYAAGQEPSGYIKIETRGDKGKITAMVQNLKEGQDEFNYNLYIFRHRKDSFTPVFIGTIPLKRNYGEIKLDFNAHNVEGTGYSIKEFKIAAVLVERKDELKHIGIICPLAAYDGEKTEWRSKAVEALYHGTGSFREKEENEVVKKEDVISKYDGDLQSRYIPLEDSPEFNIPKFAEKFSNELPEQSREATGEEPENTVIEDVENIEKTPAQKMEAIEKEEAKTEREEAKMEEDKKLNCIFADNSFCAMQYYNKDSNPCESCCMNNNENDSGQRSEVAGDMVKFRECLDAYFDVYDPFGSRRRDYKWWKLTNPAYLSNILYQSNIKTPLLFNPSVIMAHFKYSHLIIGIYTDRLRRREYIVCGLPSVYKVDERPFDDVCRWAQQEIGRPRYGAFGYWLVYIDPRTGKFLRVN